MDKFKYISKVSIQELENSVVIPCMDEEGNHSILIKNKFNKSVLSRFNTDNLDIQIDATLHLNNQEYYFHIITNNKNDNYSLKQFQIIYEYIFKKFDKPVGSDELIILISSLEEFFKTTPDPDLFTLQVGVFGELFTLKTLYRYGYTDIINKYHNNFYSKHDMEIDTFRRIEIKTTVSEKRIHNFKHNQIARTDIEVYVCSVMLEESQVGLSLYELFLLVISLYSDPESIFSLRKLMKKCNVSEENYGVRFAIEKANKKFKIFSASLLPKIEADIPDSITNIKYDVNCSSADDIKIEDFINMIK